MTRFARRPPFETYSPGRKDARIGEAKAMLSVCSALHRLTARGLACQFNLKDETADRLIGDEKRNRGDG